MKTQKVTLEIEIGAGKECADCPFLTEDADFCIWFDAHIYDEERCDRCLKRWPPKEAGDA